MGKIYIISDLHHKHTNMAIFRGFNSVEDHDDYIKNKWNSVVKKKDTVWIIGDITMEKSDYSFLDELNGIKKVVLGNHDQPQHVPELLKYVNKVCGMIKIDNIWLTHCPMHPLEIGQWEYNVHGHVHKYGVDYGKKYFNVCAEKLKYKPIELNEIKQILKIKL